MTLSKNTQKLFFGAILLLFQCSSLETQTSHTIQRINSSLAIFLDQDPIQCSSSWENDKIFQILLRLKVNEKKIFSETEVSLFPSEITDWRQNSPYLKKICHWRWVWIEEDQNLPGTRIFRTHIEITLDSNSIHLILQEYKQSIQFQNQFSFADWAQLGISRTSSPDLNFQGSKVFMGYTIKREGQKFTIQPENSSQIPIQNVNTSQMEEKLIELKSWYERGLITEEEYRKLKKELLERYKN